MADLTLTCPHCGFTRTIPAEQIPGRPLRITCPKCRGSFSYRKPGEELPPLGGGEASLPAVAPVPANERSTEPAESGRLRGIGELFRDSWEVYIRRIGVLMGLYLLAILFLVLPVGAFALFGAAVSIALPDLTGSLVGAGILTGIVVGSVALFWGLAAMVYAVADSTLDLKSALKRGWNRVWPFAWVFSLTGFIVTGGFLLLVVPGIIFSVWFFLSQFVLAAEDERGMRALLKSKAYLQGHFFEVLFRLIIIWILSSAIGVVPILGAVLSLLFVPYMMIYGWLIYEDLRSKNGDFPFNCTTGEKAAWLGIGALGFLIVPLSILLLGLGWIGLSLSGINLPWRWTGF